MSDMILLKSCVEDKVPKARALMIIILISCEYLDTSVRLVYEVKKKTCTVVLSPGVYSCERNTLCLTLTECQSSWVIYSVQGNFSDLFLFKILYVLPVRVNTISLPFFPP